MQIGPEDLNKAKLDVDHIAELATSLATTATDRNGNVKLTWTGIQATYPEAVTEPVLDEKLIAPGAAAGIGCTRLESGMRARAVADKLEELLSVSDAFGFVGDGVSDDTAAFQKAIDAAALKGLPVHLAGKTCVVQGVVATGSVRIVGPGVIRHAPGATAPAIQSNTAIRLDFENVVFDGNRAGQTQRFNLLSFQSPERVSFKGCDFKGTVRSGLRLTGNVVSLRIEGCTSSDMAEHGGTVGQISCAADISTTSIERVWLLNNRVTALPASAAGWGPGGFIVSTTAVTAVVCSGNYFENIGQRQAENFIGCLDLYVGTSKSIVSFNEAKNSGYVPFKIQNARDVIAIGNVVDGLLDVAAAGGISIANARNWPASVRRAVLLGNSIRLGLGAAAVPGIGILGSSSYYTDSVTTDGNIFHDTAIAYGLEYVKDLTLGKDIIEDAGGTNAIYIQNTDQGTGAPSEVNVTLVGTQIKGAARTGIFARTNVTNLNLKLVGVLLKGTPTNYHVSIRGAKSFTSIGCTYSGLPGAALGDVANVVDVNVVDSQGESGGNFAVSGFTRYVHRNNAWDTLSASLAYAAQTIAPGTVGAAVAVTVTGASPISDRAEVVLSTQPNGLILSSWVSANNTVTFQAFNPTGASITLAAGTATATARR